MVRKSVISAQILQIKFINTSYETALGWMPQNTLDESTLVQLMVWYCQATSHNLSQQWPRSIWSARPKWVKLHISLPLKAKSPNSVWSPWWFSIYSVRIQMALSYCPITVSQVPRPLCTSRLFQTHEGCCNTRYLPKLILTFYVLNFSEGNINIYLHFVSSLHIDMTQVLKILPQVRPGPTYSM